MKSFVGLCFSLLILVCVVGGGALIWYLSATAEFSRTAQPPAAATDAKPAHR